MENLKKIALELANKYFVDPTKEEVMIVNIILTQGYLLAQQTELKNLEDKAD